MGRCGMNKLKNCPFCGSKSIIIQRINELWDIGCTDMACHAWICPDKKCESCVDGYVNKIDALNHYNQRAE